VIVPEMISRGLSATSLILRKVHGVDFLASALYGREPHRSAERRIVLRVPGLMVTVFGPAAQRQPAYDRVRHSTTNNSISYACRPESERGTILRTIYATLGAALPSDFRVGILCNLNPSTAHWRKNFLRSGVSRRIGIRILYTLIARHLLFRSALVPWQCASQRI